MTSIVINDVTPIVQYTAGSGQTVFTYPFPITNQDDLKVYQRIAGSTPNDATDILTITTEYTVTGVSVAGGGTVVLVTGATVGDIITIIRDKSVARSSLYTNEGTFTSDDVNLDFNNQTLFAQDNEMDFKKKGLFYNYSSVTTETKDQKLPVLAASQYWQMNAGGTALQAVALEDNADVNTLRSELASQTALAPGSDLIGVYTTEVPGDTLTDYLNAVEPPISDNIAIVENAADNTKRIKMDASGITTATTRTITMPDNNVDLTNLAQATTTVRGTAEIATDAEILAGTNDTNFITPKGLHDNNSRTLQVVTVTDSAFASGTTIIPLDDTIPQITEGDEYLTLAITPLRTDSTLLVEFTGFFSSSTAGGPITLALFRDSTADALAAIAQQISLVNETGIFSIKAIVSSAALAATTFKLRAGPASGSHGVGFNGTAGARIFGGVAASSMVITEYI